VEWVQVDVGEDRAAHAPLWGSDKRAPPFLPPQVARPEGFPDQAEESLVRDPLSQQGDQDVVVDLVEAGLDVALDDPGDTGPLGSELTQGRVSPPAGPEAMTTVPEGGSFRAVVDRFEDHVDDLLRDLVPGGRDAERPHLAVRFRDVLPPRGFELEALVSEGTREVLDGPQREAVERHPVRPGGHVPGGGLDLLVRDDEEVVLVEKAVQVRIDPGRVRVALLQCFKPDQGLATHPSNPFRVEAPCPVPLRCGTYYGDSVAMGIAARRRSRGCLSGPVHV